MLIPGLRLLEEQVGSGPAAETGDHVSYDLRIYLNRGDEVPVGKAAGETVLGKRRVIAGIEKSLIGMRAGGYRKVRISPHLAYGDAGVADAIPPAAVLCVELWLREILPP